MTRKQAALRAIELLSENEENREICEALERIVQGRLTQTWNKELALEAIQDFISENGYYPSTREMDDNPMLPAHPSARLAIGMGYAKIKETFFPDVVTKEALLSVPKEEWMEKFIEIYRDMGMPTFQEFNKMRKKDIIGGAETWVRRTGCESWIDLLKKSGFKEAVRKDRNHHCELSVTTKESSLPIEEYDRMEDILTKVLA